MNQASDRVALQGWRLPPAGSGTAGDNHRRQRPGSGRFILSGSANPALLGHVSETLAGRAGYFTLHPMTRREQRGATAGPPFLIEFLRSPRLPSSPADPVLDLEVLRGGLPPACLGPRTAWTSVPRPCADLRRT